MEPLDHLLTFSTRRLEAVIREFLVHITRPARTRAQEHHCPAAFGPAPLHHYPAAAGLSATIASEVYSTSTHEGLSS